MAARLGPGLITGAADDDPSGIATYSQAGAQFRFSLVWTLFLTLPLMIGIQMLSARIGWVTQQGLATNIGRNVDPELLAGIVALSGVDVEVQPGERLPDEVLDSVQTILTDIMISPNDVADAVLFAVSRPSSVHITDLAIRPNKDFDLGG